MVQYKLVKKKPEGAKTVFRADSITKKGYENIYYSKGNKGFRVFKRK